MRRTQTTGASVLLLGVLGCSFFVTLAGAEDIFTRAEAQDVVFPEGLPRGLCADVSVSGQTSYVRCLVAARFAGHGRAQALARELFDRGGHIVGVERAYVMDGGFRGHIELVPALPVRRWQKHLTWVASAMEDFDQFFTELAARAARPIAYRWRPLSFRFFRSVGRTTPSAYAHGWTVAYNLAGSLFRNASATREVLFHEIFHLNDAAHDSWSDRALATLHASIVARCGTTRRCLLPYSPTALTVRGGTYYAFQPDNGDAFHEYAADLATRYYREQRAALRGETLREQPFKCGPEENVRAWNAIRDEFFAGVDLVRDCPR